METGLFTVFDLIKNIRKSNHLFLSPRQKYNKQQNMNELRLTAHCVNRF